MASYRLRPAAGATGAHGQQPTSSRPHAAVPRAAAFLLPLSILLLPALLAATALHCSAFLALLLLSPCCLVCCHVADLLPSHPPPAEGAATPPTPPNPTEKTPQDPTEPHRSHQCVNQPTGPARPLRTPIAFARTFRWGRSELHVSTYPRIHVSTSREKRGGFTGWFHSHVNLYSHFIRMARERRESVRRGGGSRNEQILPISSRDNRSRTSSSDSGKHARQSWACLRQRHCYLTLLLGSVLANVLQLVAFFFSRPESTSTTLRAARTSYDTFVGAVLRPAAPQQQQQQRIMQAGTAQEASDRMQGTRASTFTSIPPALIKDVPSSPMAPMRTGGDQQQTDGRREAGLLRAPVQQDALPPAALERHPTFRVAFTVPWIGRTFPSWFPYFLASCRRSAFLADWLIFHESAVLPGAGEAPSNVIFHDLGRDGLGLLFGTKIASALGMRDSATRLVELFRIAFREFAYIVTEYKPTHGAVFADYLKAYSHWSYTDIDMLIGDLPLYIDVDELEAYDIFTYHFGDVFRLYLRGQFAAHRNLPWINVLWAECPHLGSGLVQELEVKHEIVRRLAREGKHGRTRFISAEGCYSWVVASTPGMRLKFASKAFADWSDHREFYVVDGAVRKCALATQVWEPHAATPASGVGPCNPFGPRVARHSLGLHGVQRPVGQHRTVDIHAECSRWVERRYRLCADLTEEEAPMYNVMLVNGSWSATRFVNQEPPGSLEGAFLHLQRWKGDYKRLTYGAEGMPRLDGRSVFKLSRVGFGVYDMAYDDVRGANVSQMAKERHAPRNWKEADEAI